MNSTTPCPLIHHITLLRALLRTEGKEAKGEGEEGGGGSPADLVTHAQKTPSVHVFLPTVRNSLQVHMVKTRRDVIHIRLRLVLKKALK